MRGTASQGFAGFGIAARFLLFEICQRAGAILRLGGGTKINQLDGEPSRNFRSFLGLPPLEVGAEDEKFAPDLDNANLLFLNDSAEMAYRKAG
jgi:hypothetical protein